MALLRSVPLVFAVVSAAPSLFAQHWLDSPMRLPEGGEVFGAGDADGDGDLDLVWFNTPVFGNLNSSSFRLLVNDGTGHFLQGPATSLPTSPKHYGVNVPIRDLTGDGLGDVLVYREASSPGSDSYLVFPGAAGGAFGAPYELSQAPNIAAGNDRIALGDSDGDGRTDVATWPRGGLANGDTIVQWWHWNGSGFTSTAPLTFVGAPSGGTGATGFCSTDFDGDGDADLVGLTAGGNRAIFVPSVAGAPTLGGTLAMPAAICADRVISGDLEGDGDADLVAVWACQATTGLQLAPFVQGPAGTFTMASFFSSANWSQDAYGRPSWLSDWDGDGDLDLLSHKGNVPLIGGSPGALAILENDGAAHFALSGTVTTTVIASVRTGAGPGDFDGDGVVDFAAPTAMVFGDGKIHSSVQPIAFVGAPPSAVTDADGDGDADLVYRAAPAFQGQLFLNDATGAFTSKAMTPPPGNLFYNALVAAADFTGDGRLDGIASLRQFMGFTTVFVEMRLLRQEPSGEFSSVGPAAPFELIGDSLPLNPTLDADLDGDLDFLDTFGSPAQGGWWENAGLGAFPTFHPLFGAEPLLPLDADQDGDTDYLARNATGALVLERNDGPGGFAATTIDVGPFAPASLHLRDLDGDLHPDLAVGGGLDTLRLYAGVGGTFAPAGTLTTGASTSIVIGSDDVDGDGVVDLLVGQNPQGVSGGERILVYRGAGGFAYEAPQSYFGQQTAVFGDVDGDGDLDVLGAVLVRSRRYEGSEDGIVRQYASGLAGTGNAVPLLGASGPLRPGSPTAALHVRNCAGAAPAALLVGTSAVAIPSPGFPGFFFLVDPILDAPVIPLGGAPGAAGAGQLDASLGGLPAALAGLTFTFQVITFDLGSAVLFAHSNGLELVFGQ
ncbi:MAG TPA: VCBS repeat-containing protein [Planctomycetota bacterium]|nr:VCBS repeat-containing protein [Planctomycetota bacterium]